MNLSQLLRIAGIAICAATQGCSSGDAAAFNSCLEKGRTYFQEVEAWPKLSDGRNAETVVIERCRRTDTAFG
jgi:hypothetical protein